VISDLVGVPDLFGRIKPVLLAAFTGRRHDRRVSGLKPRARAVVTAWVCITVPVLVANAVLIGRAAPHLAAVTATTARVQAHVITAAAAAHRYTAVVLAVVELVLIALPVVAGVLTAAFMSYRSGFAAADWNGHRRRPKHRRRRARHP